MLHHVLVGLHLVDDDVGQRLTLLVGLSPEEVVVELPWVGEREPFNPVDDVVEFQMGAEQFLSEFVMLKYLQ